MISDFIGIWRSYLVLPARVDCANLFEVDLSLPKAQAAVRTAQDALRVRLILTVVLPIANAADFVLPTTMQGLEFAAGASKRLGKLPRFDHPFHWLNHRALQSLPTNLQV
jgi:hypothetical protein